MNTWSMSLQNSNSPVCDMMTFFHDFTMMNLIFIILVVLFMLIFIMRNKLINRFLLKNHTTEMIWTIFPMFILIYIAMPSIKILYITDEMYINNLTVKVTGHQWYWSYEYSNFHMVKFDSFMIQSTELKINEFRLLEVDNRCVLPFNYPIQILTTSSDVIHAWTVPSLGIKMDSTPGRLNQTNLFMNRPGLFFGQCSEICGLNHSFMPIVIESTNLTNFKNWLIFMYNKY